MVGASLIKCFKGIGVGGGRTCDGLVSFIQLGGIVHLLSVAIHSGNKIQAQTVAVFQIREGSRVKNPTKLAT